MCLEMKKIKEGGDAGNLLDPPLPTPQAFRFLFLSLRDWALQLKAGWEQVAFLPLLTPCAQSCFFFCSYP